MSNIDTIKELPSKEFSDFPAAPVCCVPCSDTGKMVGCLITTLADLVRLHEGNLNADVNVILDSAYASLAPIKRLLTNVERLNDGHTCLSKVYGVEGELNRLKRVMATTKETVS